jgi:hypothetical protein
VGLRILRVCVSLTLMASGALMYAASSQRWSDACPWGNDPYTRACDVRMDHLYDFLPPTEPWKPAGMAAELAGASVLVFAMALAALPWALTACRPGRGVGAALLVCVLAAIDVGAAALRSGLADTAVSPLAGNVTIVLWLLALPVFYTSLALLSRGWAAAAAVLLVLGSPLVAAFSYAIGPFDARPWYEAISGVFVAGAGACLLVEAARRSAPRRSLSASAARRPG